MVLSVQSTRSFKNAILSERPCIYDTPQSKQSKTPEKLRFLDPAVLAQPGALELGSVSTCVREYVSECVRAW